MKKILMNSLVGKEDPDLEIALAKDPADLCP
jgi:hypothetical protein